MITKLRSGNDYEEVTGSNEARSSAENNGQNIPVKQEQKVATSNQQASSSTEGNRDTRCTASYVKIKI